MPRNKTFFQSTAQAWNGWEGKWSLGLANLLKKQAEPQPKHDVYASNSNGHVYYETTNDKQLD